MVRKIADGSFRWSHTRVTWALLASFVGCLNPLPEEYPSNTETPDQGAPATAPSGSSEQGAEPSPTAAPGAAPMPSGDDGSDADEPESNFDPLAQTPPDAGADAGAVDAGLRDGGE